MKKWKANILTAAIALLVAMTLLLVVKEIERSVTKSIEPQPTKEIKSRISQYELVKEEQQLITEILTLRYEAAVIQSKFKPAPQPVQQRPVVPEVKE